MKKHKEEALSKELKPLFKQLSNDGLYFMIQLAIEELRNREKKFWDKYKKVEDQEDED